MPGKFRRKFLKFWAKFRPYFFVFILILLFWETLFSLRAVLSFAQENNIGPTFLWSLVFNENSLLKTEGGSTNLLILGMAGGNHQASDLTDTMIFLNLNHEKKKAILISLPRDIWSPTLKDKINSAYHYGGKKKEDGGLILAKLVVEEVLGQPVHYALLIDFSSFKEAIDVLGGIDVEIDRSFDDFQFPIEGKDNDLCAGDPEFKCRYEHIHFEKGWEHMNGERALKYVRSRNAEGDEGSDFARAVRQQKVILAFKNKVFSYKIFLEPIKIKRLFEILRGGVESDIKLAQSCFLGRFALELKGENVKRLVLEEKLFTTPPLWEYGKWVLVPPEEDFTLVHQYIKAKLDVF